jgi:hypothetical protein
MFSRCMRGIKRKRFPFQNSAKIVVLSMIWRDTIINKQYSYSLLIKIFFIHCDQFWQTRIRQKLLANYSKVTVNYFFYYSKLKWGFKEWVFSSFFFISVLNPYAQSRLSFKYYTFKKKCPWKCIHFACNSVPPPCLLVIQLLFRITTHTPGVLCK